MKHGQKGGRQQERTGEKAHCKRDIICASFLFVYILPIENQIFFFNTIDLLVIQKFNDTLKKLSNKTSMPDTFTQYWYVFQMVPKSRRHLKVSVPQIRFTRSITTKNRLCYATCIGRKIQGIGFVQP